MIKITLQCFCSSSFSPWCSTLRGALWGSVASSIEAWRCRTGAEYDGYKCHHDNIRMEGHGPENAEKGPRKIIFDCPWNVPKQKYFLISVGDVGDDDDINCDTQINLFGKEMTLKIGMFRPSPLSPWVEILKVWFWIIFFIQNFATSLGRVCAVFFISECLTLSFLTSFKALPLEMKTKKMMHSIFAIIVPEGEDLSVWNSIFL